MTEQHPSHLNDHHLISPRFGRGKLANPSIEDKIDVYEDRLQGWIFDHADWMLSEKYPYREQAVIAALLLTTAYFEQHWSYRTGEESKGREFQFFSAGFDNVFRKIPEEHAGSIRGIFWEEIRCKLAHEWLPGSKVIIASDQAAPLGYSFNEALKIGSIVINSQLFVEGLHQHFRAYVRLLRDRISRELTSIRVLCRQVTVSRRSPQ